MPRVYVAAGSNVDAPANLRRALDVVRAGCGPLTLSPVYANAAVGFEGDDFLNLVFAVDTALPLADVLEVLHRAETACGRPRNAPKWAPRAMDLDVLLYGDEVGEFPGAVLPRPDLVKRAYMLGPLAALAPEVVHPTLGRTIGELWAAFDKTGWAPRVVASL